MKYVVMAGVTYPAQASFNRNVVCNTEDEAKRAAEQRNNIERHNGNSKDDVLWFVMPMEVSAE